MRFFSCCSSVFVCFFVLLHSVQAVTASPPHIILVMADDQGWGDTGYNGHPFVQTPAMDAMAAEGLVFDRFYAASPVCSPTRASVLTGRTPIRTKVVNHGRYMRPHEHTIAEALKEAGYVTGIFGKFHLGSGQPDSPCNPSGAGFDEWCIGLNFFDMDPYLSRNGIVEQRKGKGSVALMDDALAFLEEHKDGGKPIFTIIWFPSPHDPFGEVPEGPSLYDDKKMKGYYREITLLDQQLGRLRSELDAMGLAENTLLWYTSDNGGLNAETSGGRMKKGSIYEGGLRVPSVAVWPAGEWKGRTSFPAVSSDFYPTLLAIAGAEVNHDHPLDGINLLEHLDDPDATRPSPLGFWFHFQGGQATWSDRILKAVMEKQAANAPGPAIPPRMLKDVNEFPQFPEDTEPGHAALLEWPWKFHQIRMGKVNKVELYNLADDPMEANDLAAVPEHKERADKLQADLSEWMTSVIRSINGADYKPVKAAADAAADAFQPQVEAFEDALKKLGVKGLKMGEDVVFSKDDSLGPQAYAVDIKDGTVAVRAAKSAGAAFAAADLLRRVTIGKDGAASWEAPDGPDGKWEDAPDFPYRSFMVDMGRNPHSPKTLRHVVDMMWFYRGSYLQLHLTDDQIISWPSEVYPEIHTPGTGWTLDDFRELEAYSQARGVTIVPELEVPGHSNLLRQRRPDVFGKSPTELATDPKAQKGVEALIKEMLSVFKATPYMHIGADEAWGVPEDIQRDFINRINTFVRSQGRTTLAWEGPNLGKGDNKVSEDVIHLAWESKYLPMTDMVAAGYTVINAAWDPFYIVDHYPRNNFTGVAVDTIYNVDLRRMKAVDPGLRAFNKPQWLDNTDSVLGFTMPWWEGREFNLLPMCLERFAAASTRAWDYDSKLPFEEYAAREAELLTRLETISGFTLPAMPVADAKDVKGNLAFGAKVTPSAGAHQPHFAPERLTNGITDRFDIFLGFPTKPEPLLIDIELPKIRAINRVRIHEIASQGGWEKYRLHLSADGKTFEKVAETKQGSRGKKPFSDHRFDKQEVSVIRIETDGFESFTFPSFSRLSEVEAFADD